MADQLFKLQSHSNQTVNGFPNLSPASSEPLNPPLLHLYGELCCISRNLHFHDKQLNMQGGQRCVQVAKVSERDTIAIE